MIKYIIIHILLIKIKYFFFQKMALLPAGAWNISSCECPTNGTNCILWIQVPNISCKLRRKFIALSKRNVPCNIASQYFFFYSNFIFNRHVFFMHKKHWNKKKSTHTHTKLYPNHHRHTLNLMHGYIHLMSLLNMLHYGQQIFFFGFVFLFAFFFVL